MSLYIYRTPDIRQLHRLALTNNTFPSLAFAILTVLSTVALICYCVCRRRLSVCLPSVCNGMYCG